MEAELRGTAYPEVTARAVHSDSSKPLVPGKTCIATTTRAFSSADPRRRRPGPVSSSIRRKPPFASSLTSRTEGRIPESANTKKAPEGGGLSRRVNES